MLPELFKTNPDLFWEKIKLAEDILSMELADKETEIKDILENNKFKSPYLEYKFNQLRKFWNEPEFKWEE